MATTVLIISSSSELGRLYEAIFSAADYNVLHMHDYEFDLQAIEQAQPRLIVFDLAAGEEGRGWQNIQMLRMYQPTTTIPALVCTMQKALIEELEGHLLTLNIGSLLKPFTQQKLLDTLTKLLAAHQQTAHQRNQQRG